EIKRVTALCNDLTPGFGEWMAPANTLTQLHRTLTHRHSRTSRLGHISTVSPIATKNARTVWPHCAHTRAVASSWTSIARRLALADMGSRSLSLSATAGFTAATGSGIFELRNGAR